MTNSYSSFVVGYRATLRYHGMFCGRRQWAAHSTCHWNGWAWSRSRDLFLPRDASCVRPTVCPTEVGVISNRL